MKVATVEGSMYCVLDSMREVRDSSEKETSCSLKERKLHANSNNIWTKRPKETASVNDTSRFERTRIGEKTVAIVLEAGRSLREASGDLHFKQSTVHKTVAVKLHEQAYKIQVRFL